MADRWRVLKEKAKELPQSPGVYIFKDVQGKPIYVGKAVSLKQRVSSYFNNLQKQAPKTKAMLRHAYSFDVIELEAEDEALIKENELIKQYQPHYNIMMRDDKTYPWVKITILDPFPRIYFTRKMTYDGSLYYGPFPNVGDAKQVIQYVIETYKIRDCRYDIQEGALYPACLSLQIDKCDGPCQALIDKQDYRKLVKKACAFLDGEQKEIISRLRLDMEQAAAQMKYERAAEFRDMIASAEKLRKGALAKTPRNVEQILNSLASKLELSCVPRHIECFDISNISGTNPVASMVVFKNGVPSKSDYRKYKIKTVEGPNDFAMMHEVIVRRYSRLRRENKALPDLVIVDGGKGQLSLALAGLTKVGVVLNLVGLAKKQELIFKPGRKDPYVLSKHSEELKLFQRIRDEAHRFAITFHRKLRDQRTLQSQLCEIPGIGPKAAQKMLQTFKSLEVMAQLSVDDLQYSAGLSLAQAERVIQFFRKKSI